MADVAQGKACPNCGTLTACTGDFDSETLNGPCPCCGASVSMPHIIVTKQAVGEHPVAAPTFVQVKSANPQAPAQEIVPENAPATPEAQPIEGA